MASTVVFKLPDDLNGTPILSEENVDPVDMSPANLFARLFYDAKASFTAKAAAIFDRDADFPMMRFIELRSRQTKSGKVMPVVNVTRPQAADSLVKFMYGQENKGKQACQKCKDGTGAFNAYVTLDEMSPGCATCHHGGAAKHCSLVSGGSKRSRDESSDDEPTSKHQKKQKGKGKKKNKKEKSGRDYKAEDVMDALMRLDNKSLRVMKNVFEALLDGNIHDDTD